MDHSSDRRILIVEDDSTDFRQLREALRESVPERFVVKHASRLHQAREMVERETFDILLLDISLVDVHGLDDVAHIVEQFSSIPLIVLGTQTDEEFGMRAVRAGAQDYLVKRFVDADVLERAITHAIARHQHQYQTYSLERRFQAFVDGSKELHAIADASGILTYTSFELERPSGYTYGETARQSWFSLLHRDDQARAREMWAELLAHPNASRELQVRFGQGGHAWRVHNVTLTNALKQPAVAGVIIQSQDVTQEVNQQRMLSGLADITRALAAGGGLDSKLQTAFEVIERVLPVEEIRLLEYQDDLLDDTPVVAQRFAWRRAADGVAAGEVSLEGGGVDPRIAARVNELATSEPGDAGVDIATQIFQNHVNAPDNPVLLLPYSLDDHVSGAAVVKARDGHLWSDEETTALDAAINVIGSAISRRDAKTLSVNSDSRLEDVLSVVRDGVVVFDQSGLVRYANPALQDITGMRPGDFLKSNRVLLSSSAVRNFEQVIERGDGRQATITIDVARFPDGSGGVSGGVAYVRENTSIQRAVQLLHGNEARLRAIVATAFEAIITTDDAGVVESFNPAAEAMFGFAADEIIGQEISRIIPEPLLSSNDDALNPLLDAALVRSGGQVREMKALRADGSVFPIELSAREYVHRNQRKYIGSIRDISQRRAAENRIAYQIHQLESLRRVDRVLGSSRDLDVILDVVLDQLVLQPDIDAAVFRLFNDVTQSLELRGARGFDSDAALPLAVHLGEGLAGCAALERKRADLRELNDEEPSSLITSIASDRYPIAGIATPLVANGQLKGTLEIYRFRAAAVATGSINFVGGLASQTAVAIDNTELFVKIERSNHQLERAYEATLEGWSQALEMRGVDTAGHSQRVSDLAVRLGRLMGIDGENVKALRRGALLHDIGKIGVSDAVLHKPGNLDEADWAVIQQVPTHAHRLLSSIPFLRAATEIPYCHHEKWDGSGYPRGLREETIPFAARVFAVVDVWDTLISDRPYRAALTRSEALGYIASQAGKHFDPDVVSAFLEMMAEEEPALEPGGNGKAADLVEDAAIVE